MGYSPTIGPCETNRRAATFNITFGFRAKQLRETGRRPAKVKI